MPRPIAVVLLAAAGIAAALWLTFTRAPPPVLIEAARAVPRDGSVDVYATIRNPGTPDWLVSAASPEAEAAALTVADPLAEDRSAGGLPIPAGHPIALSADGGFVRLSGLDGEVADGRLIPVTLTFAEAGPVAFKARIARDMPQMAHGSAICRVEEGEPSPRLRLSAEPAAQNGWTLALETEDFRFAQELVDGSHVPGTGHAHVYVGGVKLTRLYEPRGDIPALPPGRHTIRVTLNSNDHRTYVVDEAPVTAVIEVLAE